MSFIIARLCGAATFSITPMRTLVVEPATIQIRNYAARKGTRERKQKKKVKQAVVEKTEFVPHNQRNKEKLLALRPKRKFDDSRKRTPLDDVYVQKYYQQKIYPFAEAVLCHRETHHPDMYNVPDAPLHVTIELNMQAEKKTRFVDNFTRFVAIPHKYDHGEERPIMVFSKDPDLLARAHELGAHLTGGVELIKQIQNGTVDLADFKYVVAHPEILPELVPLRGLMKRKFPNPKNGSLDVDVVGAVQKFLNGINYSATRDEYEKDFGVAEAILGTLGMDPGHLEENFAALVRDVCLMKPRREGDFITRCLLWSPPSRERLKVDHNLYVVEQSRKRVEDEDEEDVGEAVVL